MKNIFLTIFWKYLSRFKKIINKISPKPQNPNFIKFIWPIPSRNFSLKKYKSFIIPFDIRVEFLVIKKFILRYGDIGCEGIKHFKFSFKSILKN